MYLFTFNVNCRLQIFAFINQSGSTEFLITTLNYSMNNCVVFTNFYKQTIKPWVPAKKYNGFQYVVILWSSQNVNQHLETGWGKNLYPLPISKSINRVISSQTLLTKCNYQELCLALQEQIIEADISLVLWSTRICCCSSIWEGL